MTSVQQTRRTVKAKADASSWPSWTDDDRWELGPERFEPTDADWADFAAWLDSLGREGGCGPDEPTPSDAMTIPAIEFHSALMDTAPDCEEAELAELRVSL